MALMDFIKKQFIDIIEWTEDSDGTLAWRFPMEDREIQNGGSLTVRESQVAVFVNEGKVADVFGPGRYTLTTATLPVLTYLQNWDKLFEQPVQERRLLLQHAPADRPALGHAASRSRSATRTSAPCACAPSATTATASPTRASSTPRSRARASATPTEELDGQLRGLMLQNISDAVGASGTPFLDLAANQVAVRGGAARRRRRRRSPSSASSSRW